MIITKGVQETNKMRSKVMEGTKINCKRMKENQKVAEKHDYLAELPEPLLHHILSFLTMKDLIRTSFLAKRWRYTWLYASCLTFSPLKTTRPKEAAFITRSLLVHKGPKVQKLNITFDFTKEALLVGSWIHFALTRNVNQLYLDFGRCGSYRCEYIVDDIIFSCSSLAVLALKSCIIVLPVKNELRSLKTLSLEEVEFHCGGINDLLPCCSILEQLSFTHCYLADVPDLVIMNASLKTLKIGGGGVLCHASSALGIYAPFITSFELIEILHLTSYVIKRMESLHSASVVCSKSSPYLGQVCTSSNILGNLQPLFHVKDFRVCSCYLQFTVCFPWSRGPQNGQAMSSTEHPSREIRDKHVMNFISFDVTRLRIKTGLLEWELPGIAFILLHSPNVESLIVSIEEVGIEEIENEEVETENEEINGNVEDGEYWKLQDPYFSNHLCNLKDVKIYDFLKNSKVMERMTITTFKNVEFGHDSESKKLQLLFQLTRELLWFPRASQAAQISFN